jgi:hypothetical protein
MILEASLESPEFFHNLRIKFGACKLFIVVSRETFAFGINYGKNKLCNLQVRMLLLLSLLLFDV